MPTSAGQLIQNKTWLVPIDGNVTNPALSYVPNRNSGFSRLGSNLNVSINGVQTATLFSNGVECIGNINITQYLLGNGAGFNPPTMTISNVQVANASYTVLDDTAVDTAGGYIIINGANMAPGTLVSLGSDYASAVTYVSPSQLRAQVPAKSAGSYTVTATRLDGKQAVLPLGITYSPVPAWSTGSTLANVTKYTAFTQTLSATEASNANVTYALAAGSSLPANVTLLSNGLLSGNIITDPGNTTVFSFIINAIDAQLQDIGRTFSLTALADGYPYTLSGLVGWYDGSSWTGTQWTDRSGAGNHAVAVRGTVGTSTLNGRTILTGTITAGIKFPVAILPSTYTFFHVARYSTTTRGRIFGGVNTNWLSGFYDDGTNINCTGVAFHNGWLTPYVNIHGFNWVLSTDQNNLYRSNSVQRSTTATGTPSYAQLSINYDYYTGTTNYGDWQVAEVIVYNRTLSLSEIQGVEAYLASRYGL